MNATMGEVKIKIKIVNATDEGLFRRGKLESDQIRSAIVDAVVDTGAPTSVLTPDVATRLGLRIVRQEPAVYANSCREEVDIGEPIEYRSKGWISSSTAKIRR